MAAFTLTFAAMLAAFVGLPLASLAVLAASGEAGDIALWPHLVAHVLPAALVQTASLVVGVMLLAGALGTGAAIIVTNWQFPGRELLLRLLPLPLAIPTYIAAYVYVELIGNADRILPVRSLGGAIVVFGIVLYPYVYLAARAMLQTQPAELAEAARMLGARPRRVLTAITLPLARPALAVGLALVALETLNDIGASEYLGVRTLTLEVFTTWLNRGSLSGAAQIALILLAFAAMPIAVERVAQHRRDYAMTSASGGPDRVRLDGWQAVLAAMLCATPVLLGFVVPAGFLLHQVWLRNLWLDVDPALWRALLATLSLSAAAAALVMLFAALALLRLRSAPAPLLRGGIRIASLGYALPGTVLALGLLAPLVALDGAIGRVIAALSGAAPGLVLIGSGAALVIVYVARFFAVGAGFLGSSMRRIAPELDDAALMLGARPVTLAFRIHLPLLRPALWGAALLVFVDCLKELPATLLLRPLDVETLSTYVYQFATRGSFEDGALASLLIVAAGLLPAMLMARHAESFADSAINPAYNPATKATQRAAKGFPLSGRQL